LDPYGPRTNENLGKCVVTNFNLWQFGAKKVKIKVESPNSGENQSLNFPHNYMRGDKGHWSVGCRDKFDLEGQTPCSNGDQRIRESLMNPWPRSCLTLRSTS